MIPEDDQGVKEGLAVAALRRELLAANFDGAKVIEREQMIPPQAVSSVVNSVFETFLSTEKFVESIELGQKYDLPIDKINDAIYLEFRRIITSGDVDKAIEWALSHSLPDYEITRAAARGIESAIINKNIELAVEIKRKYSISEEQLGNVWQKGYDEAFAEGKFFDAALLSREFGMSDRKTIITAAKAFRVALQQNDFDKMVHVDEEFRIFNDTGFSLLGEEEGRSLIKLTENFLREKLRSNELKKAVELVHGLGIVFKDISNHTLRDLVHFIYSQSVEIHQLLLHDDRYDDAVWFMKELNLLEENTPEKTLREIFNQAISYHNKFLKNSKTALAMKVKQDYDLLGAHSNADSIDLIQDATVAILADLIESGDTKAANLLIREYNIPQEEIEQVATGAVVNSLNESKHEKALDIMSKFKLDSSNFEIKAAAKEAFDQCRANGYNETAANIGFIFEIASPAVKESARHVWEDLMRRQEYRKAAAIKKKHRLTKRYTETVAKEEYDRLVQTDDIDTAQKIRTEYRVNIGFFTLIIEFIRKILLLIFGKGEEQTVTTSNGTEGGETSLSNSSGETVQEKNP